MIGRLHVFAQKPASADSRSTPDAANVTEAQPSFAALLEFAAASVLVEAGKVARFGASAAPVAPVVREKTLAATIHPLVSHEATAPGSRFDAVASTPRTLSLRAAARGASHEPDAFTPHAAKGPRREPERREPVEEVAGSNAVAAGSRRGGENAQAESISAAYETQAAVQAVAPRTAATSPSAHVPASVPVRAARESSVIASPSFSGMPEKDRTFGFADLGMFGRHAPSFAVPEPVVNAREMSLPRDTAAKAADDPRSSSITTSEIAEDAASPRADKFFVPLADEHADADTGADAQAPIRADDVQRSVMPEQEMGPLAVSVPSADTVGLAAPTSGVRMVEGEEDIAPPQESGAPIAPPPSPSRAANPLRVTVSGPDDALAVVARSQGATAEDALRLHALVEDTAREFGMDVAEFLLNGAAAGKTFHLTTGGKGGSRSR